MRFKIGFFIITLLQSQIPIFCLFYNPWSQCFRSITWERNIENQLFIQKQREIDADIGGKLAAYTLVLNPIKETALMNTEKCAAPLVQNIQDFFEYSKILRECSKSDRMRELSQKQMEKISLEREKLQDAQSKSSDFNEACEALRNRLYEINQETTTELNRLGDECLQCAKQHTIELTIRSNAIVYEAKACQ